MKIVIINSILKTPEKNFIPEVKSIKDTLIYNFSMGFVNCGHDVTLISAEDYSPRLKEEYPIKVIFLKSVLKFLFPPSLIPFHPYLFIYLLRNRNKTDIVISSEAFSISTLIAALLIKKKLVIWQELKQHNRKFFRIPSLVWYNLVAQVFLRNIKTIPRSERARSFIRTYIKNTGSETVTHGVDLDKFEFCPQKEDQFAVIAQLIKRKNINIIFDNFEKFIQNKRYGHYKLLLTGTGPEKQLLIDICKKKSISSSVIFTDEKNHLQVVSILNKSKGILISSARENVMLIIPEAIACGTPILTNSIPDNADIIIKNDLGIVKDNWGASDMELIVKNNKKIINNCKKYRNQLSFTSLARKFLKISCSTAANK
ncbi:MAG: hypothetical protein A2096_11550 [Spirochaetes bacterium GWF1_41_5]|nr:MAG: hypothetical protein A2096_11550 [Spirochaetes bacterium GWF1_41_5]HBE01473.1 glycosyl transferase family 1 [Spirochaetia bacterium]